jgi:Putative adhesin
MTIVNSGNAFFVLLFAVFFLSGTAVFAQDKNDKEYKKRDFCSGSNYSYNNKVSYKETREMTINAGNLLNIDGQRNGGIQIKGENRSDVLIRACVQTTGATEQEAQTFAKNIRIETSPNVRAENTPSEPIWGVSYEILVPHSTNLKLTAHNGGISISGVDGAMEFETQNGGVSLSDVAGDVKGKTTNGGVNVNLAGNSWKGGGLNVETTNGGVHLSLPETYAAHIETGTVNGGFNSDISQLNVERKDRSRALRLNTDLNGGGAPIRVITTNGGVKISSSAKNL